jgi:hypothetical protein
MDDLNKLLGALDEAQRKEQEAIRDELDKLPKAEIDTAGWHIIPERNTVFNRIMRKMFNS